MYLRLGELWQFNHFIKFLEADSKLLKLTSIYPSSMANNPFVTLSEPPLFKTIFTQYKSSLRRCSLKKGVLRNFVKFTGKHLCQSLTYVRPKALLKKRLWFRCFPANFAKFLRTHFLQNTSARLLLTISSQ